MQFCVLGVVMSILSLCAVVAFFGTLAIWGVAAWVCFGGHKTKPIKLVELESPSKRIIEL